MMSLGLLIQSTFGLGQEIRSGLTRRQSKILILYTNDMYSLLQPFTSDGFDTIVLSHSLNNILKSEVYRLLLNFRLKLKGVYMYCAGFYTYSIFALIFWETRRSDFGVSMGHHVATVILIVLSYIFRYVLME